MNKQKDEFISLINTFIPPSEDPIRSSWRRYALSTNARGEAIADTLELFTTIRGKYCLDVGIMMGGATVALLKRGASVIGLDITPGYFKYAEANARDNDVTISELVEGNIEKTDFSDETFDILTFPEIRCISGNVSILVGLPDENAKDKFNQLPSGLS